MNKEKTITKKLMLCPYNVEIEPLDGAKSAVVLQELLKVYLADGGNNFFVFTHNEIMKGLEEDTLTALILINNIYYQKVYKHLPIIASKKNIKFVLINQCFFKSREFEHLSNMSQIGVKKCYEDSLTNSNVKIETINEKTRELLQLINRFHEPIDIPYLFAHPKYNDTKFEVVKIKKKNKKKGLNRNERKQIKKELKKNRVLTN